MAFAPRSSAPLLTSEASNTEFLSTVTALTASDTVGRTSLSVTVTSRSAGESSVAPAVTVLISTVKTMSPCGYWSTSLSTSVTTRYALAWPGANAKAPVLCDTSLPSTAVDAVSSQVTEITSRLPLWSVDPSSSRTRCTGSNTTPSDSDTTIGEVSVITTPNSDAGGPDASSIRSSCKSETTSVSLSNPMRELSSGASGAGGGADTVRLTAPTRFVIADEPATDCAMLFDKLVSEEAVEAALVLNVADLP
mmetsp:Transcript_41983/g.98473  ORF Transcript_41983/g.98473 Transcript_41983/m.98473 type:complete len:250 (-) Transcript_41983:2247-2996(-)